MNKNSLDNPHMKTAAELENFTQLDQAIHDIVVKLALERGLTPPSSDFGKNADDEISLSHSMRDVGAPTPRNHVRTMAVAALRLVMSGWTRLALRAHALQRRLIRSEARNVESHGHAAALELARAETAAGRLPVPARISAGGWLGEVSAPMERLRTGHAGAHGPARISREDEAPPIEFEMEDCDRE